MEEFKPTDDLIKQTADLHLSMPDVSRMPEESRNKQDAFFPNTIRVAAGEILQKHGLDTMTELGFITALERATRKKYRKTKRLHHIDRRRKEMARIINAEHRELDPKG